MRRHIKLLTTILILTLFMIFGLTGCGEKVVVPVMEPTVEITEEGELIAYLVEDFDKEYYDLGELETMVREEVADFDKEGMTVESVAMAADGSKKVVVALRFANSEIYADYFDVEAFFGTVSQAQNAGYGLSAALTGVKDGEIFTEEDAQKNSKRKILIIEGSVVVRCPKEVLYIGTNASITEEGFVDCTESEGLKLIIMK